MDGYTLENDRVRAVFDGASGALAALVFKDTGWLVQRRAELARSFDLLVPVAGKRHNRIDGRQQRLTAATVDGAGQRIDLRWERLTDGRGVCHDIVFNATVTLADNRLECRAAIEHRSGHIVEACVWPWLGDLRRPPGAAVFKHLHMGYGTAVEDPLFPRFESQRGCFGVERPVQLTPTPSSPFVLAHDGHQGLYAGYHDTTALHLAQFRFELYPGFEFSEAFEAGTVPRGDTLGGVPAGLSCGVVHFPFAGHGTTELAPVVLAPYAGSWHHGADHYKAWRKTWYTAPPRPNWVDEVHAWQQLQLNSPEEEYAVPYRDLPDYATDCAEHGIAAMQLTGWADGGQDRHNPSHDTEPGLGTREELGAAIAEMERRGVHAVLFTKFTWADRSTDRYRTEWHRYAMKDPYGDAYYHPGYMYLTETQLANINTRRFIPLCMNCEAWIEAACAEFDKVASLNAAGMLYDECQHHGGANYCFDPDHGHAVPAHVFAGDARLAEAFAARVAEREKPFLFAGEDCYDLQYRHYALSYFRIGVDHIPLQRYIAPDAAMMVAVLGYNNRTVINQALLYRYILSYEPRGFKGRLHEFPLSLEYGKRVDALRRRYVDRLWHAEFRGTLGAAVKLLDGPGPLRYSVFVNAAGQRAVVVANPDYDAPQVVQVRVEGAPADLAVATPEAPGAVPVGGPVSVPPVSAAVFMTR